MNVTQIFEQRWRDAKQPNFCFTCNGSGRVIKPINEWNDSDHEYHACPRKEGPTKVCEKCKGTGKT